MPLAAQPHHADQANLQQPSARPAGALSAGSTRPQQSSTVTLQRARLDRGSLTPGDVLQLQRTFGNRAVGRLLAGGVQPQAPAHLGGVTPPSRAATQTTSPVVQRKIAINYSQINQKQEAEQHVSKMLEYLTASTTGARVWHGVANAEPTVELIVRSRGETRFYALDLFDKDPDSGLVKNMFGATENWFITWNVLDRNQIPQGAGSEYWLAPTGTNTQSPANALLHELGHAWQLLDPEQSKTVMPWKRAQHDIAKGKGGNWQQRQARFAEAIELHNLLHHEVPFSAEKGEPVRTRYSESQTGSDPVQGGWQGIALDLQQRLQGQPLSQEILSGLQENVAKRLAEVESGLPWPDNL